MIFELPIKDTYVPDWGKWECVRELIQNAKDEEDDKEHEMQLFYVNRSQSYLEICNMGADLKVESLVLGEGDKAKKNLRGMHSEGLALALLAGTRAGWRIEVFTQTEKWTSSIQKSKHYKVKVLNVTTRKLKTPRSMVSVHVYMTKKEWEKYSKRFIFLRKFGVQDIVTVDNGSILLTPECKGEIYVKGIFVQKTQNLKYGYDLWEARVDRDRKMISNFDFEWQSSQMQVMAMARRPELMKPKIYAMLRDGAEDVRGMDQFTTDGDFRRQMAEMFRAEHGEKALVVDNIGDSKEASKWGYCGVVVPKTLKKLIDYEEGSFAGMVEKMRKAFKCTYSWDDLDLIEQEVLGRACQFLNEVVEDDIENMTQIVAFKDDNVLGEADVEENKIYIARNQLKSLTRTLCTLVHEEAHILSRRGDDTREHVDMIEELWVKLFEKQLFTN